MSEKQEFTKQSTQNPNEKEKKESDNPIKKDESKPKK